MHFDGEGHLVVTPREIHEMALADRGKLINSVLLPGTPAAISNAGGKGAYNLSNGLLTTQFDRIGRAGAGSFTQSGGTQLVAGELDVGYLTGSSGTYSVSAGLLSTLAGNLYVSNSGSGTFLQSGGVVTIAGTSNGLYLGNASSTAGM
jgi:hypothetical protein